MRNRFLLILATLCGISAQAQTLADTTSVMVFDRTNQWIATGAELKAYCASGGGGGGDISNGGNTTGADVTIGTNDAFGLNFETNGVTRCAITGGASTGGDMTLTEVTASTAVVENALTLRVNSTGTAAAGFGVRQLFQLESSTTDNQDAGGFGTILTTATHASLTSADVFYGRNAGGSLGEFARFEGATAPVLKIASAVGTAGTTTYGNGAITNGAAFTIGGSANQLTLGGSTGAVVIRNTSSNNIEINNSENTATSTGKILIGGSYFTQTSGTRNFIQTYGDFAPTSGTAVHNRMAFTVSYNQTGGANGITRSLYLSNVITAVADYRAIEIADNGTNVKGIYQTGSTTVNNFVGKTTFGATTAPTSLVTLAAGTASANTAPLKFTSGTNLTTPENGAVEYDGTNYYATSGGVRYTLAKVLTGSSILDFGATGPGAASNLTVTVTGAAAGDVVSVGVDYSTVAVANGSFTGYVSAANTVTIRYTNNDLTTAYNPASATFKVTVTKF